MEEIRNAVIQSVTLDTGDRGLLTAWLHLDYGGSGQGFGGFALYLPKNFKHHSIQGDHAGHFIYRCMQIADVTEWNKMKGKTIRVKLDKPGLGGLIKAIGHIINDDWFNPSEDFEKMKINN